MSEKEKLLDLIFEEVERYTGNCYICDKMGWKCPVNIPEDFDKIPGYEADLNKCDFRQHVLKTLTTQQ